MSSVGRTGRRVLCDAATGAVLAMVTMVGTAHAEPVVPTSDGQVVEVLPAAAGQSEDRALRRRWAADKADPVLSVQLARRYMARAHEAGDPRYAGLALATLAHWPQPASAPDDVVLMVATVQQYLHQFETAAHNLEIIVRRQPGAAQAWLTLATVRRVQGRYAESNTACSALSAAGAQLYAAACAAENASLQGDAAGARAQLNRLLAAPGIDADTRNWLLTTLAETEDRAGRPAEAEAAYKAALQAHADAYTTMSYADFLMAQQRDADALTQLQGQIRTDAVLLRLAIIGARSKTPQGLADVREVRARMALADERPEARTAHARESAMFALWVDHAPQRALELARIDVRQQREPIDVLLLAQTARAAHSDDGLRDAARVRDEMGLHDQRLDALL